VAGKRCAIGSDEHELAAPPADTRLGILSVIIRDDKDEASCSFETFFGALESGEAMVELFAGGKQNGAIGESPTVVLNAGKFDGAGTVLLDKGNHTVEFMDVLAMNYEIQSDADAMLLEPGEDEKFVSMRVCVRDGAAGFLGGALKAELKMVETGVDKRGEFSFVQGKAAGDEADIEPGVAGGANEVDDVRAGKRFAPGEVDL
jgi:hypothetical protein